MCYCSEMLYCITLCLLLSMKFPLRLCWLVILQHANQRKRQGDHNYISVILHFKCIPTWQENNPKQHESECIYWRELLLQLQLQDVCNVYLFNTNKIMCKF